MTQVYLRGGSYDGHTIEWNEPVIRLPEKRIGNYAITELHANDLRHSLNVDVPKTVTYERAFPREYVTIVSRRIEIEKGTLEKEVLVPLEVAIVFDVRS